MLRDYWLKQVMTGAGGDEGAYGPNDVQFEATVGVEGVRDASIIAVGELDPEEANRV